MRLLRNIFFLKTKRNDYDKMSYFTEQESTANLNLQWCNIEDMQRQILQIFISGSAPFLPWLCLTGPITKAVTLKQRFAILQNWNFFQRHISLCITDSWSKGTSQPIASGTNHVQIASWCIFSSSHNSYVFLARESYVSALIYVYGMAFTCNY